MKIIKENLTKKNIKDVLFITMLMISALTIFIKIYSYSPFDVPEGQYTGKVTDMQHIHAECTKLYQRYNNSEYREVCTEDRFIVTVNMYVYEVDEEIFKSIEVGKEITLTRTEGGVTK